MRLELVAAVSTGVLLSACRPPDPKEVAARTSRDVQALVREAWQTGEQTNTWRSVDDVFVQTGAVRDAASRPRVAPVSSLDTGLNDSSKLLQRIFTEANVVDTSGGAVTFNVRGIDVCQDALGAVNTDCAVRVDQMNLRVRASGDLDLALLVGPDRIEAMQLHVRVGKSLSYEVDLDKAQGAYAFVSQAWSSGSSTTGPMPGVSTTGRFEVKLEKNGPMDFTLSYSVLAPLTFTVTGTDAVVRSGRLDARSPVLSARVEAPAQRLTFAVDLPAAEFRGLWRDVFSSPATGPLEALLAGLSGTVVVENGTSSRLTGLSLGDRQSVLRYGGTDVFTVDFNKALGRRADISWVTTARGLAVSASPGLSADVYAGLAPLEAASPGSTQAELRNGRYQASFLPAAGQGPTLEVIAPTASTSGGVKVVAGELRLAVDDAAVAPRQFSAGMCLGSAPSTSTPPRNSIVEGLAVVACP